jgi:hypothetical protein
MAAASETMGDSAGAYCSKLREVGRKKAKKGGTNGDLLVPGGQ